MYSEVRCIKNVDVWDRRFWDNVSMSTESWTVLRRLQQVPTSITWREYQESDTSYYHRLSSRSVHSRACALISASCGSAASQEAPVTTRVSVVSGGYLARLFDLIRILSPAINIGVFYVIYWQYRFLDIDAVECSFSRLFSWEGCFRFITITLSLSDVNSSGCFARNTL